MRAMGNLVLDADPDVGTEVGNRDYNDARYALTGTDTIVTYSTHTFAVAGAIAVPVGDTDYIPGFYVMLKAAGHTAQIVSARHRINGGTSATVKLQKTGVDLTGFTGISVTTTSTTTNPTDQSVADGDYIALVVTAVAAAPLNMSFTVVVEHTVTV
jgi:hypothetical protein